jgi:hypothetical protein
MAKNKNSGIFIYYVAKNYIKTKLYVNATHFPSIRIFFHLKKKLEIKIDFFLNEGTI